VQLLVHGATYNRTYWDWPGSNPSHSYVKAAVAAGYATLAVDRLGAGASSHPPSTKVNVANGATALHHVVEMLRTGQLGGAMFERVVWVGHSLGSVYAWAYATRFGDVDAYVLTGMLHGVKASWIARMPVSVRPGCWHAERGMRTPQKTRNR
jgi:pimeloyl-ACP methyl ester carboxylesterase